MNTPADSDRLDTAECVLEPADNERLAGLCGQFNQNLRVLERGLGIEIANRGNHFQLIGGTRSIQLGERILRDLYQRADAAPVASRDVHLCLQAAGSDELLDADLPQALAIRTRRAAIVARGVNQRRYIEAIRRHDINFGIGPAGTGKTYLAVACAVEALEQDRVRRICLVRPAVEAGERLGFLPGDLAQKVDPYLRPLFDALYEMLGFERVARLLERNVIEVAPLAFMRGRTLNESFIILDEAQNTTTEQMKMFLTRIGFGSTAVITGDITQIDLPRARESGLRQVIDVLREIDGISFTFFKSRDVVRHALVARILDAYEAFDRDQSPAAP
ncbi:MAG: PhoH family protein [Gammaproteobacteria bacterium]|nr:PhoH family protein [Gammaproteobacteria bacterium]